MTQGTGPVIAETSPAPAAAPDGATPAPEGAASAPAAIEPSAAPNATGIEERFSKLTKEKHSERIAREAAERDRDYWRQHAMRNQPQAQQAPAPDETVKTLEDFEYDTGKYTEYLIGRATKQATDAAEQRLRDQSEQDHTQRRQVEHRTREETYAKDLPDYMEVTRAASLPVNKLMAEAIETAENGPEVLYHLGKNPSVADQIARLPPLAAALEMGRLFERLTSAKAKAEEAKPKVSEAPPPTPKIEAGDAKVEKDPSDMTDIEFAKWRRKQIAARGK